MRELRSSLPFLLYRNAFELKPQTLAIGDYLLTPDIAVERKSTADLLQSLNNGRLYQQAEQLCRHYPMPILLIEFDEARPFSLVPAAGSLRQDISMGDISSKLCLLLLHFPKLRLLWSSSLSATADMFRDLKRDRPDPSVDESDEGPVLEQNPLANDMLLAMPGVTPNIAVSLATHVRTLRDLCSLSLARLQELIGAEGAKKLHAFLHEPIQQQPSAPPTTTTSSIRKRS